MRILHVVKTSDGASWAANQAAVLGQLGVDVHVALPSSAGRTVDAWRQSGATIHVADLSLPVRQPARFSTVARNVVRLVEEVQPDLIHSHFVTTTIALRLALGKHHKIPRVFQVAGPLHLEHWHARRLDLITAGEPDHWVGSSRCITEHYRRAGVPASRLFLSYYGVRVENYFTERQFYLRKRLNIDLDTTIVGNINFMYPPKYLLGQRVGLKCHEDVIDALGIVTTRSPAVNGVLIGCVFGKRVSYEERLRKRASRMANGRVILPGVFNPAEVAQSWPDFDCAVHVPLSENCGGVLEPLLAAVPVVASSVGGIPELVVDGITGRLVPARNPKLLANVVLEVLADLDHYRKLALKGQRLVRRMFDINRTGREVYETYRSVLHGAARPSEFYSGDYLSTLRMTPETGPGVPIDDLQQRDEMAV